MKRKRRNRSGRNPAGPDLNVHSAKALIEGRRSKRLTFYAPSHVSVAESFCLPWCSFFQGSRDSSFSLFCADGMLYKFPFFPRRKYKRSQERKSRGRNILTDLANTLREQGAIDERESFIDAMFCAAKGGGRGIGKTKRGKGVKIMGIVNRNGLPIAVTTHAANHHEVTLVQLTFDFYMIEAKPEKLIGDKAYDSDPLDEALAEEGIEMIAPHRENRTEKNKTQDGRKLRPYKRRWLVGASREGRILQSVKV